MKNLGILGVGHLASYVVAGLRHAGDTRNIILSPRNAEVASRLAIQFDCEIATSNQNLADHCKIVLLSVPPKQASSLLENLEFSPGQCVLTAMAGISTRQLQAIPSLAVTRIFRTLPLVCSAKGISPVPLYPHDEDIHALLSGLGSVFPIRDESIFDVVTVHGIMHGWVYYWLDEIVCWTIAQGIEPVQAETMVKQIVKSAIDFSDVQDESLKEIADSIAGPDTYTLAGYELLQSRQYFSDWPDALQLIMGKLKAL
jgi:pyrroline-5-carboxylate reductase